MDKWRQHQVHRNIKTDLPRLWISDGACILTPAHQMNNFLVWALLAVRDFSHNETALDRLELLSRD